MFHSGIVVICHPAKNRPVKFIHVTKLILVIRIFKDRKTTLFLTVFEHQFTFNISSPSTFEACKCFPGFRLRVNLSSISFSKTFPCEPALLSTSKRVRGSSKLATCFNDPILWVIVRQPLHSLFNRFIDLLTRVVPQLASIPFHFCTSCFGARLVSKKHHSPIIGSCSSKHQDTFHLKHSLLFQEFMLNRLSTQ